MDNSHNSNKQKLSKNENTWYECLLEKFSNIVDVVVVMDDVDGTWKYLGSLFSDKSFMTNLDHHLYFVICSKEYVHS